MLAGKAPADRSRLVRQAVRRIVEEALVGEATEALGRGDYERGEPRRGYRNGYRLGRVKSAEGEIEFAVPQVADTAEPFRSQIREGIRGRTEETAAPELTERLWADYQAFASRELGEFKVLYLFVDGIAEKLHLGQPREAVLAAWGITETGQKVLLGLRPERRRTRRAAGTSSGT
jgi:transposase-like protein